MGAQHEAAAALEKALDAFEAVRRTPGPAWTAAHDAVRPLLAVFGVYRHAGRVYSWDHAEDSLVRNVPVRYRVRADGGARPDVVDLVTYRRRGLMPGEDRRNPWRHYPRGTAL